MPKNPSTKIAARKKVQAVPASPPAKVSNVPPAAPELTPKPKVARSRSRNVPSKKAAGSVQQVGQGAGAAAATADVKVFQIFFEASQRSQLDPAFAPLDNQGATDPLLEFAVLRDLARKPAVRKAAYWGAVSWRFREKTGLDGKAFLQEVQAHPGFDVYYCNPYPENEGLYASPWQQAFAKHPGFRLLAAQVLSAGGQDPKVLDDVVPSARFSACNFFVGNQRFWDSYIAFIGNIVDSARQTLPASVLEGLNSHKADPHGLHAGATYWPFIVERLFTLYLLQHQSEIKAFKIKLDGPEASLNPHVKRLREMKDVAHHTKSQWLCSCWLQYRNLFLLQVAGKEWCKLHLSEITPAQLRFG